MISALLKPTLMVGGKKYKVMEQIGEGGFAFVYSVMSVNKEDKRENYALKKMICQTDEQIAEAEKEIELMRLFAHVNIVPLLDSSAVVNRKNQREIMMLLPLFEGTVQSRVDTCIGFPHCAFSDGLEVVHILRSCVEGLTYIHSQRYRHADFKPANILLGEGGSEVVITDFGSATSIPCTVSSRAEALAVEEYAAVHTTASYRSPELFDTPSHCVIGAEADVWSFGCAMFCMLFSRSPFESAVEGLSTLSVLSGRYCIPEGHPWPVEYVEIIDGCLRVNPLERLALVDVKMRLQCIPCPPLSSEQMHTTPERKTTVAATAAIAKTTAPTATTTTATTATTTAAAGDTAYGNTNINISNSKRESVGESSDMLPPDASNFANFSAFETSAATAGTASTAAVSISSQQMSAGKSGAVSDSSIYCIHLPTAAETDDSNSVASVAATATGKDVDPFSDVSAFSSSKENKRTVASSTSASNSSTSNSNSSAADRVDSSAEANEGSTESRDNRSNSNTNSADSNHSSYVFQAEGYCDSTYSFPTGNNSPAAAATASAFAAAAAASSSSSLAVSGFTAATTPNTSTAAASGTFTPNSTSYGEFVMAEDFSSSRDAQEAAAAAAVSFADFEQGRAVTNSTADANAAATSDVAITYADTDTTATTSTNALSTAATTAAMKETSSSDAVKENNNAAGFNYAEEEDDSEDEFGDFVTGGRRSFSSMQRLNDKTDSINNISNSNSSNNSNSSKNSGGGSGSFVASFPAVTATTVRGEELSGSVRQISSPSTDASLSHLDELDLHKVILAQASSSISSSITSNSNSNSLSINSSSSSSSSNSNSNSNCSGEQGHVRREGVAYMMRMSGFPKKPVKKAVWMVLTPAGLIIRKDKSITSKVHFLLSLHRPVHQIATDTMNIGINGLLLQGSSPLPLDDNRSREDGGGWVEVAYHEWTFLEAAADTDIATTAAAADDDDEENRKKQVTAKRDKVTADPPIFYRCIFSFAQCEVSFDSKDLMNDWMDAIDEQRALCSRQQQC